MLRRATNRVGVEIMASMSTRESKGELHSDSLTSSTQSMHMSASSSMLESGTKAQRRKELLRKKKAERRAHAKQRAAAKLQREEEKHQQCEFEQMSQEDEAARKQVATIDQSTQCAVEYKTDSDYALPEMVPKQVSSRSTKSVNDAAHTIQKALKKLMACKTMFYQSPRVFTEKLMAPALGDERKSTTVCNENVAMEERVDAMAKDSPKSVPIVPRLVFPSAEASPPSLHPLSSISCSSASYSSSCSCSNSGSCSSYSCSSCSCSSSSSRSSYRPSPTSRSDRSSQRQRRHSRRTSRTCSDGPSSSLLPELPLKNDDRNVHHMMATKIQALVRGNHGRFIARQQLHCSDQELKEEALVELQREACIKIQSRARGVLARKKAPIYDKERRRRRRKRAQLNRHSALGSPQAEEFVVEQGIYEDPSEIGEWPQVIDLELLDDWQELNHSTATATTTMTPNDSVTQSKFLSQSRLRVFCGTWNMHAKKPTDDLRLWIRFNKYHIVAVGSEECVNSIAKSVVFTSKKTWEDQLRDTLGPDYVLVASHALTAIHNVVFVHTSILPLLGNIQSDAIATGLGNQLGNKGGVGIAFTVGRSSFAFVNCHFDAHQRNVSKRNGNFHRINHELRLSPTGVPSSPISAQLVVPNTPGSPNSNGLHGLGRTSANRFSLPTVTVGSTASSSKRTISERFDRVFWYGDLNYRINGTRRMVDTLLLRNQYDVLYANDQLQREMRAGNVFDHFHEGQLHFRPTYKFDKRSDVYDSSSKQRIPSWTDRVLYLSNDKAHDIELLSYRSQTNFRTSDHRPVCAIFQVRYTAFNMSGLSELSRPSNRSEGNGHPHENHVSSQVCIVQ